MKIDEEKFYNLYKSIIAVVSTRGNVWASLSSESRDLLTRLKLRELEESKLTMR